MSDRRQSGGRGGGRDDKRREDDRGRSSHGSDRNRRDQQQHSSHRNGTSNGGGMQMGGGPGMAQAMAGGGGRGGAPLLNGQAFSESELMTDLPKKKFTGRCRLFVGNLPNEVKEQELKDLFSPHGDIAECYLSGKGFAFLRLDTRAHAESAKEAIDGRVIHGRQVRVRFAVHGAALRVKELSPTVSNEMLYHAFSHFGDVERAVHIVDEKGRPTGEGIVEFERKPSANEAIASIKERVFLLTASPKPLVVEALEPRDEDDGLAERMIPRTPQLLKEREMGPRFPAPNSFEFVYGQKWKELYEMERQRRAALDQELKEARVRLEADMELAYQDYQAQMLREDLQRRQQELERLEAARRERMSMQQRMGGPPPAVVFGGVQQPPPQEFGGHPFGGGPMMQMGGERQQPFGGGGPMGGPPQGPPPQQGGPFGGPPSAQQQRQGGPNMMEGVQRLLQIFKSGEADQRGGPPPNQQMGGGPPPGQPQPLHAMGGFFGGPPGGGPFGAPPHGAFRGGPGGPAGDYPPEKRRR